jgi:hypothetical protein
VEGLAAGLARSDAARPHAPQLPVISRHALQSLVHHALVLADAAGPTAPEDELRRAAEQSARAALEAAFATLGRGLSGDDLPAGIGRLLDRMLRRGGGEGATAEVETLARRPVDGAPGG